MKFVARCSALMVALLFFAGCAIVQHSSSSQKDVANTQHGTNILSGLREVEVPEMEVPEAPASPALPVEVRDAKGEKVEVRDVSRIVTIDMSSAISQTLLKLGLGKNIVGKTASDTDARLAHATQINKGGPNLNVEAILALKPSLVLTDGTLRGTEAVFASLKKAGVTVVYVKRAISFEEAPARIEAVAHAVGLRDEGEKLAKTVEKDITDAKKEVLAKAQGAGVAGAGAKEKDSDEVGSGAKGSEPGAQAAGSQVKGAQAKDSQAKGAQAGGAQVKIVFLNIRPQAKIFTIMGKAAGASDIITAVGGKDVAGEAGIVESKPASQEALLTVNPDVYFVMAQGLKTLGGVDKLLEQPGIAQTRAGKEKNIVSIPDNISLSFGPQSADVIRAIGKALYK